MAGLVYLDNNIWRYENAGTADLLSVTGTTLTGLDATQAKRGIAFYQTNKAKCFDIPGTKEIWIKFDVYFDGSNRWRAYNAVNTTYSNGISAQQTSSSTGILSFFAQTNQSVYQAEGVSKKKQRQTYLLHMISSSSDGIVEAWADGVFVYRATGNVNNGNDLADIYLQSDGSGTFFSNVIISNAQIDFNDNVKAHPSQYVIAPELYASIKLSKGELNINPQIYATIIIAPKFESSHFDTQRKINANQSSYSDTLRQIGIAEIVVADTSKIIGEVEKVVVDTRRFITASQSERADTLRVIFIPAGMYFTPKIFATVIFAEHFTTLKVDTLRQIGFADSVQADTLRQIGNSQSTSGDTLKIISALISSPADTLRKIVSSQKISADTLLRIAVLENVLADTSRKIGAVEIARADTLRSLVDRVKADTLVSIRRTQKVVADTIIRVPHILNYVIENNPLTLRGTKALRSAPVSLVNSFKDYGITSLSASLNEKTLSDQLQIETASHLPFNINDQISFQLLDYTFNFLIEGIVENNGLRTVSCMYDVDRLLYSQIFFSGITLGDNKKTFVSAGGYIGQIAEYLGFSPNVKIQDFTPYHDFTESNITYSDLLHTVFGWTSRVPQRQINVFIRGNTLHCIQRGLEDSTFDISELPHSRPIIEKKLIRSVWNNPAQEDDEDEESLFSGTISYSSPESYNSISYSNGLLINESNRQQNGHLYTSEGLKSISTNNKSYSYRSFGNDEWYLKTQKVTNNAENYEEGTKVSETVDTEYFYKQRGDEVFMFEEDEVSTKKEYTQTKTGWELTDSETSIKKTYHTPVGNGWYAQNVFLDGEYQGSNLSQGKPGNSISLYTVQQASKSLTGKKQSKKLNSNDPNAAYEEQRRRLAPIADISFPVHELSLVQQLTNDLIWLNRKIQEIVTVDLISPIANGVPAINHIVDFTERIILDGNEYFLMSNQISFTPRKLIQKLKITRWYAL